MTSSTAVQAVVNGTDTAEDVSHVKREHGMLRVQEEQVYHSAGLAEAALYEAERLVAALTIAAIRRSTDRNGDKGTEPIDMAHVASVIGESLDCIDIAAETLSRLSADIRSRQDDPF